MYPGDTLETISGYTNDYTTLGYNVFLKHNIGSDNVVESNEVCYILNSNLYCLKGCGKYNNVSDDCDITNYEENVDILYASFGESN